MRKKTGFTLIELLAVIVILAVIALIATPLVLNIIERAEKGAFKDSVYGIMEAAEFQVILDGSKYPVTYVFPEDSNRIQFKGTKPTEGYIQIVTEGKMKLALGNGRWCAVKDVGSSQVTVKNGKCEKIDLNRPIISGYGNLNQEINMNETYTMPNVTATDKDGNKLNVTTIIKQGDKVVESIDTSKVCTYTITYTTEADRDGNTSTITVVVTIIKKETDTDKIIEDGLGSGGLELIDNTYYYQGNTPKNWIQFNGELWRIISIENGSMKIIRNDSIGDLAWDNSNSNDWNRPSNIRTYLNETYYPTISEKSKQQMREGNFYIGTVIFDTTMDVKTAKSSEMSKISKDMVGLMNASDYVYSSGRSSCINKALYNTDCKNGWLYNGKKEWTINASSSYANSVMFVHSSGGLQDGRSGMYVHYNFLIRPVLFLKESVKIVAGEGTAENPYVL